MRSVQFISPKNRRSMAGGECSNRSPKTGDSGTKAPGRPGGRESGMLMRFRCPESEMPYAIDIDFAVLLLQLLARLMRSASSSSPLTFPTSRSRHKKHPSERQRKHRYRTCPFGVQDMVRMDRLGAPIPSPDGQRIVFTVRSWDASSNQPRRTSGSCRAMWRGCGNHGGEGQDRRFAGLVA